MAEVWLRCVLAWGSAMMLVGLSYVKRSKSLLAAASVFYPTACLDRTSQNAHAKHCTCSGDFH